jgi:ABC-type Fe3+ transport system permease subunit
VRRALGWLASGTAALGLALATALAWWITTHEIPTEESTLDEKQ